MFQNYDTIYVRFFSHVYLQSFLLHDIRAFFGHVYLRSFYSQVYDHFLTNAHIYAHKKLIYMRCKQACGIWGQGKSSCKRNRIIPPAKIPFMYDGAEK